jgi:sterol 3beta-glucosyltransferase
MQGHRTYFSGVIEDCWQACQGADAIVASPIGYGVPHVAEKLRIPYAWGLVQPMTPTRSFPFFLAPLWLTGLGALLSYRVAARITWSLLGGLIRDWRLQAGLPAISRRQVLANAWQQPILYAFSSALVPRPPEWPEHHQMTGFWFLETEAPWHPPAELARFLAAGPPPLCVGLGAMSGRDPSRLAALLREALARTGRRAVVLGEYGPEEHLWPATVYRLDSAPHHRLMPLTAAAIHHGGAGTSAAALRAGLPAFGIPGALDQPFWAGQIAAVGAAVAPVPVHRLTAASLTRAIESLANARLHQRAEEIGEKMRREDGVAAAVEILERRWHRIRRRDLVGFAPMPVNRREPETSIQYLERVRRYYSRELRSYLEHVGTTWQGALVRSGDGDEGSDARASNLWLAGRAGIRPGETVLDAGCGICGPSMDIAEGFPGVRIEALTLGADQANTARGLVAGRGLTRQIRLHVGDFHHLPFAGNIFDRILFFESSGYSYDVRLLAGEALRVLRPGGTLYVKGVFLAAEPLAPDIEAQFGAFDDIYAHRSIAMTDFVRAVAGAGFTEVAACELNELLSADHFLGAMFENDGQGGRGLTPFGRSHHRDFFTLRPIYGEIKACKPDARSATT